MFKHPSYTNPRHWGIRDQAAFDAGKAQMLGALEHDFGIFASDNLIAFGRNLGFIEDDKLRAAWEAHCEDLRDRSLLWRTANVAWAVRHAIRLDGDFAEFGVYRGVTSRIICDLVDLSDRRLWLYDAWGPIDGQRTLQDNLDAEIEAKVRAKFAAFPFVRIIKGVVPDSFAQGLPDKVAFAHIDMNNVAPEIAALEALESRLVPGAAVLLDDYGWLPHRQQFRAETEWFAERGRPVMELPTGQGLVIW